VVLDVEPLALPPGEIGREFIRKILGAGVLLQLDADTPNHERLERSRLWFQTEEIPEKSPVRLDSEESFAEVDEDGNMANGIGIQLMELDSIEIEKALEERARGEGQSPFGKMVKCDDFVNIFHGKRFTKRRTPFYQVLPLKKTLRNKIEEILVGALTEGPLAR
jgi:hypothetical protein